MREGANRSPLVNRSFLHGERRASLTSSDKVVYATLDSLALKRARLPLQLVPLEDCDAAIDRTEEVDNNNKGNRPVYRKASSRRPSFKVRPCASGSLWKYRTRGGGGGGQAASKISGKTSGGRLPETVPELLDLLLRSPAAFSEHEKIVEYAKGAAREAGKNSSSVPSSPVAIPAENPLRDSRAASPPPKETPGTDRCCGKKSDGLNFTKHVLHCVPRGDRAKRSEKRGSKESSAEPESNLGSSRLKSLSKEELKYVTISLPTNFVHVASATNSTLMRSAADGETAVITHEEKCATLPPLAATGSGGYAPMGASTTTSLGNSGYVEIRRKEPVRRLNALDPQLRQKQPEVVKTSRTNEANEKSASAEEEEEEEEEGEEKIYEPMSNFSVQPRANSSFLWGSSARRAGLPLPTTESDGEEYDDVGPARISVELQGDEYDDVGLLPSGAPDAGGVRETAADATRSEDDDEDDDDDDELYDDVLPPSYDTIQNFQTVGSAHRDEGNYFVPNTVEPSSASSPSTNAETRSREESTESGINAENRYLSVDNEYSNLEDEETEDQGVYDDVGLPSQERINSLYAGSSSAGSQPSSTANGKESEWEDLDDTPPALPLPRRNGPCARSGETLNTPSKKKLGQRWSRKVRRQRSRASRKSSATSSNQTRHERTSSVAVSLGTGTVLLVGPPGEAAAASPCEEISEGQRQLERSQGLVQLRILVLDDPVDTQEMSCYVSEDAASDDSNYETLYSSQVDDFSSDSETESFRKNPDDGETVNSSRNNRSSCVDYLEAPSRPTPPPPREASLSQTLGRRMKMLRRTWSITKGSLGRMRRRTSGDSDGGFDDGGGGGGGGGGKESGNGHHIGTNDHRKYFSFKKHFRKSLTGLSTFYLENQPENGSAKNNNQSKEEVYSNSNWYSQAGLWQDSGSLRSEGSGNVDHYSVLAEEPLYQFYAAATARVAFESDSDGYEEVEDVPPPQVATDLAKPGHRTLWCQTPQVIHSGLLQRLTMEERKVQEAKFEIITSEASYLNSLRVLETEFVNNYELIHEILTPSEKEKLFGGVADVRTASERLLGDLENVWREDPMLNGLPDILLKYADRSSATYVEYCSNQVRIDTTLKELRARKGSRFSEVVSRIEMHPACQSLSLHSFLMLPMQRVTRLPLLADAVLSKLSADQTRRASWERVLSGLSQVVAACNEGARAASRQIEMEALARKLEYSPKVTPVPLRDKYFVRSGSVVQLTAKTDAEYKLTFGKKFHKTHLYLLLLTDYLLVTKNKVNSHDETYTVIDTCKRNLVALEAVSEDSSWVGRHAMILTLLENHAGREVEYVLTCESDTERERWLDAVSPPKTSLVGERLYESWDCPQVMALYSYAPRQPDELALQPGDVINVLRKMVDGWNHGERLLDGEQGWFPANYTKEVASEHVRARNLRQRHRFLALSGSVLQRRAKQSLVIH